MILFLYGEDTYRSHQKLLQRKEQFLSKYKEAGEIHEFDMEEDVDVADIETALRGGGLFATKKFVLLKRVFSARKEIQQKLVDLLGVVEALKEDVDTVLVVWDVKPDKRSKLFKLLKKESKEVEELDILQGAQLNMWIKNELKMIRSDVQIEEPATRELAERTAMHSGRIHMELEKLVQYVLQDKRAKITVEDVQALVSEEVQGVVFEALDALGSGDKRRAFLMIHTLLEKEENHPIYLLTMCAYQIRNLLVITSCYEDGLRDPRGIAAHAKMAPFVVQKLVGQVKNFSVQRLKKDLQYLARLDIAVKLGKIEPELALEEFILKA